MSSKIIFSRISKLAVGAIFVFAAVVAVNFMTVSNTSAAKVGAGSGPKIRFVNKCSTSKHVSASWSRSGIGFSLAGNSSRLVAVPQSTSIKITTTMWRHNGTIYIPAPYTVNKTICG